MRIAVLANCQGESVSLCTRAMNPTLDVDFIMVSDLWSGKFDLGATLRNYDWIFAQKFVREHVPNDLSAKVLYFPSIAFPGFHPDMTYLRARRKNGEIETVLGPMYSYHSAITVFGYVNGLTVEETLGFYNFYVFTQLGYFDAWNSARADLLDEGASLGVPLNASFNKWAHRGCFMHSFNHPQLNVMVDITRSLLDRAGIVITSQNVDQYLSDPLKNMPIWPVYPAIAERIGLHGDYTFKYTATHPPLSLNDFVTSCYRVYDDYEFSSIEPINFSIDDARLRLGFVVNANKATSSGFMNPYKDLRREQFWKYSVAGIAPTQLDPVLEPRFTIERSEKIATAGSCFAQHIARTLASSGFNYFIPETAPDGLSWELSKERNFGVYSARYGNIYTVRQLLQMVKRVQGKFIPEEQDGWLSRNGQLVDPFRPQIEPEGFADVTSLKLSREAHFHAIRRMLVEMNVFIFTLGLTEGWRSKHDGAVFPLAPGVAGGQMDFDRYEFVNFTVDEIKADLDEFIDILSVINPTCRIILTVSPVPLIATYEQKHALVATTYSKSVLRTAAEHATRSYSHVEYFPSYEIITGSYSRGAYFEEDLRSVTDQGVAHVMRVFMTHYAEGTDVKHIAAPMDIRASEPKESKKTSIFDIVCDEEAIAKF